MNVLAIFSYRPNLSAVEYLGIGLFSLINLLWIGFAFSVPAAFVFDGITLFVILSIALSILIRRRDNFGDIVGHIILGYKDVLVLFLMLAGTFAAYISLSDMADFTVVTIGNNDVYNYASLADFLLSRDRFEGRIGAVDLIAFIKDDVFGAFALLALTSYISKSAPIISSIVPMVTACAVIAFSVYLITSKIYKLQRTVAFALGVFSITGSLFAYSSLQYFLSQILSTACLLLLIYNFMNRSINNEKIDYKRIFIELVIYFSIILYIYPIAILTNIVAISVLIVIEHVSRTIQTTGANGLARSIRGVFWLGLFMVGVGAGVGLVATERTYVAISKFQQFSTPNAAGWQLNNIRPAILAGLFAWPPKIFGPWTVLEFVALASVLICAVYAAIKLKLTARRRFIVLMPLTLFIVFVIFYTVLLIRYSDSYQQWKFASTYVVIFAFAIPASFLAFFQMQENLLVRRISQVSFFILVTVQVGLLVSTWQLLPAPRGFAELQSIDSLESVHQVIIDFPEYSERMLTSNFIRSKALAFTGPTYFGNIQETSNLNDGDFILRRADSGCYQHADSILIKGGFNLSKMRHPYVPVGHLIDFSSDSDCFGSMGLGGQEAWGRWTVGKSAKIAMGIDIEPNLSVSVKLVVQPFLVEGVLSTQKVVFVINGILRSEVVLQRSDAVEIILPISQEVAEEGAIEIEMSLPNATSPAAMSISEDTRELAIGLLSMELIADHK